jgi:hypothetical protein
MSDLFSYEKWRVTVSDENWKLPPECLCPAAYEAGRRAGLTEAAEIAEDFWPNAEWLNDASYREREAVGLTGNSIAATILEKIK